MSAMRKAVSEGEREVNLEVAQTRYPWPVNAYTPGVDWNTVLQDEQRLANEIADELRDRGISARWYIGSRESRVGDSRRRDDVLFFTAYW
jgi:hypothetical protein